MHWTVSQLSSTAAITSRQNDVYAHIDNDWMGEAEEKYTSILRKFN